MKTKSASESAFFNPRILLGFVLCSIAMLLALVGLGLFSAGSLSAQAPNANQQSGGPTVGASYKNDISPPVRNMPPWKASDLKAEHEANENPKVPYRHHDTPDPVIQKSHVSTLNLLAPSLPAPLRNFNGIPFPGVGCNCAPPDTNGAVGQTQYVQIVNEGFQVFDKATGSSLLGPNSISSIWTGFGGACEAGGSGDPVVLYDHLANRWMITQFASATGGTPLTDQCVALSTTADATGTYAPTSMVQRSRHPVLPPPSLVSRVRAPILITQPIIFTPTLRRLRIRPLQPSPHQPRRVLPPSAPLLARVCRSRVLPPIVTWMVSVTV